MENTTHKQYQEVIRLLLEYYYDPRYSYKLNEYKNDFTTINADNPELAIKEIETYIKRVSITNKELTPY